MLFEILSCNNPGTDKHIAPVNGLAPQALGDKPLVDSFQMVEDLLGLWFGVSREVL